ncbi:citrate transporter [Nesterenkonia sp. MY13]|uniref:Citrate transporter n=1 Tax=Nesterenkonia sedimenti TaxID=1463632 RepID=A0A7X8THX2_9MICC|nr:citrate:proton symporter [Nesterenkonia sedimenti]NLS09048.1 citrate transporter [Nesterenkonia sedimenti]
MLAIVGFFVIALILALLLTQRVHAIIALAGIPLVGALIAGYSLEEVSGFATTGIGGVVGVVAMFVFAIIFFGVLRDAGMFDPVVDRILRFAGDKPATITLATTLLALVTHLDGAGASTFLITIPAMLPLYERMGMSRLVLATCVALGAGVMNVLPWGGPTVRAAATAEIPANELWVPLIPAQAVGIVLALAIAYYLGVREKKRLARVAAGDKKAEVPESTARVPQDESSEAPTASGAETESGTVQVDAPETDESLKRPKLLIVNFLLTVVVVGALIAGVVDPAVCFIVGAILALVINYPGMKQQTQRINAHAPGAVLMASTLLAAGVLLGVLSESGMVEAMAESGASLLPEPLAPALPVIAGLLGVPLSLAFGPDAYYFGVMPVLMGVGSEFGVDGTHIAQASILGQETVGFPISPMTGAFFLLVGLAKVDIGRHIRHSFLWLWLISVVMVVVALIIGVIPGWA